MTNPMKEALRKVIEVYNLRGEPCPFSVREIYRKLETKSWEKSLGLTKEEAKEVSSVLPKKSTSAKKPVSKKPPEKTVAKGGAKKPKKKATKKK